MRECCSKFQVKKYDNEVNQYYLECAECCMFIEWVDNDESTVTEQ